MKIIADLHIHSKYSRATSKSLDLENLNKWAKFKGINLLATSDFTHPTWLAELKGKLEEVNEGIFKYKENEGIKGGIKGSEEVYFILGTELSSIYSQAGQMRRIHNLVFAPSFEIVEKINQELSRRGGNLYSDGRPILGLSSIELCKILFDISPDIFVVPAHVWTPWFSLYGSNSGFDSISECFGPYTNRIKAIETGLSSDPAMNWRIAELDSRAIISGSDAHSAQKIGREAIVLDLNELTYDSIISAISSRNSGHLSYTIEFFPEEGKYHFTGHRACQVVESPTETKEKGDVCPVCGRKLTVGVMHRVSELASRPEGYAPEDSPPFKSLVPLQEIIAEALGQEVNTKAVENEYFKFTNTFFSEFNILLEVPISDLEKINPKVAEGVLRVKEGKIQVSPGYDGVYGKVKIWGEEDKPKEEQVSLFE